MSAVDVLIATQQMLMGCMLAQPCEYDWTICVHWQCGHR